jgi:hypothetical protein
MSKVIIVPDNRHDSRERVKPAEPGDVIVAHCAVRCFTDLSSLMAANKLLLLRDYTDYTTQESLITVSNIKLIDNFYQVITFWSHNHGFCSMIL